MEGQTAAERGETGLSPRQSKVKPGIHLVRARWNRGFTLVPADPEPADCFAGGTSVTEVPFLVLWS
jgi:hypothetical protein